LKVPFENIEGHDVGPVSQETPVDHHDAQGYLVALCRIPPVTEKPIVLDRVRSVVDVSRLSPENDGTQASNSLTGAKALVAGSVSDG